MSKIAVVLCSLVLIGCASSDEDELRRWMEGVAQDTRGKIPPLPAVEAYEPVAYDVGNLIDPFRPSKMGATEKKSGGFRPDLERPKEPLEAFPLESLKYVGVLTRNKTSHAIVQVDSSLYQVKIGNYMGQNFGVVIAVTDSEVTLRELIQDSAGDWVERTSNLLLQEKGASK